MQSVPEETLQQAIARRARQIEKLEEDVYAAKRAFQATLKESIFLGSNELRDTSRKVLEASMSHLLTDHDSVPPYIFRGEP